MKSESRTDLIALCGLLVLGQVATAILFSLSANPLIGGDSYLSIAQRFPSLSASEWPYGGYVILLRLGMLTGSAAWFAVAIQCIAAGAAGGALLSLGRRFSGSIAGWIAAATYLLHPLVAQWTRYVLTESLFYSGVIAVAWLLVRVIDLDRPFWWPLWLTVAVTASMRPNGIFLIGAAVSIIAIARRRGTLKMLPIVILIWSCVLVLATLSSPFAGAAEENRIGPRTWSGDVVWNVPEERIEMPQPSVRDTSNSAFIGYAIEHPVDVALLGARRVWWELKQVRPWYSQELNAFTAITMATFYLLAAVGAWTSRRSSLTLVVTGLSLPFMALIGVTWAIWEGRFGWWFLVVWTTWVGIGAERLMEVIRLRSRSTGLQPINWDSQQDDARSEICETDHSGDYPG